ncbi:hypothetical protein BURMUCGD1_2537 [Burkholderia multivorans CGD1]|nr:hypothetical protein BURMUCGD1_2537 [Burkholderia multivorans CGD1]
MRRGTPSPSDFDPATFSVNGLATIFKRKFHEQRPQHHLC